MYQRYGGGNMDEGWTRLMFEQFNVPFKSLMDAELKKGDLNASYDVIVLPADSIAAMTGERPQEGGGGGRGGGAGGGAGQDITPPEYRSGFGAEGVKALQGFVQKGGTLRHVRSGRRSADPAFRPATAQRRRRACRRRSSGLRARRFACASTPGIRWRTGCRKKAWRSSCPAVRRMK